MIRLFVDQPLQAGAAFEPAPEQSRYLIAVMRQAAGDEILVFNGRDGEWRATLAEVSKRSCRLVVGDCVRTQAPTPDLVLIVALVKRARLETIVEKATELGVRAIQLMISQYTNADHTNVSRLQAIAVEAAEQTGRLDVPVVLEPAKLSRVLEAWPADRKLLFCDEGGQAKPLLSAVEEGRGGWSILIGPEGGFSNDERTTLRSLPFVKPASLGPRILRADTAAIAALSLWQARVGDWLS